VTGRPKAAGFGGAMAGLGQHGRRKNPTGGARMSAAKREDEVARGACLRRKRKLDEYAKRYMGLLGRGERGGSLRRSGLM
jgi:hypothetical protein